MNSESQPHPVPESLEAAANEVLDYARRSDDYGIIEEMLDQETPDQFIAAVHMGFGMWMRNNWGLWAKDGPLFDQLAESYYLVHADDLSGIIMLAAWQIHKHGKINEGALRAQAASYLDHWRRTLLNEASTVTVRIPT